jgi:hypothetical protein
VEGGASRREAAEQYDVSVSSAISNYQVGRPKVPTNLQHDTVLAIVKEWPGGGGVWFGRKRDGHP